MHSFVQTREQGVTATITLNRPERLNSYTLEHLAELSHTYERLAERDDIRVLIITGSGLSFCTGIDIGYVRELQVREEVQIYRRLLNLSRQFLLTLKRIPQFLIAAVNGSATGGGLNLALFCDWRIASTTASFGYPFGRLSWLPDPGATWILPQLVGRSFAVEMALSDQLISAREALQRGLIQQLAEPEELNKRTDEMARRVASYPPLLTRYLKRWLVDSSEELLRESLEQEIEHHIRNFLSYDLREGLNAFLENRNPKYQGL
ncbi:MAG TPA: enoyl-CoA hydratase/isomerase family protein [Acidobacteriota bacterium]|nr:enoyl-CoA hydratase/isomerase family protein [Acidobacteriota bacterium]